MVRKALILSIGIVSILLFFHLSYAAPAYGTHMPEKRHWIWGMEGSFIIDRNLDNNQGGIKANRFFLDGSYGIFPWLSFDGKIGVGEVDWDRNGGNNIDYGTGFAGGYGFRIKGYENEEWGIKSVVGFQHISIHPPAKNQGGNKHEVIVDEWQGSAIISKDIGSFVPYLGVKYGTADCIKWVNEKDRKRIHSERYYGVIVGMDCWMNKRIRINLEGTFLDGEELAVSISRDF